MATKNPGKTLPRGKIVEKIKASMTSTVTSSATKGGKSREVLGEDEESFDVPVIKGHPARVRVQIGLTVQPQPYESIRIDAGLEYPCEASDAGIEAAFKKAAEICQEKVHQLSLTVK